MKPVYVKKVDPSDRTTWMDWFIALEPKGGARDFVGISKNGNMPNRVRSGANGHAILLEESSYAVVTPV